MDRNNEKGTVLVLTMIMLVLCSGLLTATYLTAIGDVDRSKIDGKRQFAESCAESGVEHASKALRNFAANFQMPLPTGVIQINGIDVNWSLEKAKDEDGNDIMLSTVDDDDFNTISKLYIIQANCIYDGYYAKVSEYLSLDALPIFQFFAFYDNDLEFFPGADMKVDGRIFSNKSIYMGTSATLKFMRGNIRSAGDVWRYRKDSPSTWPGGKVSFPKGGTFDSAYDSDWEGYYDGEYMDFAQRALEEWEGFLMTCDHGVSQIDAPNVAAIKPFIPNSDSTGDYSYNPATGQYYVNNGAGDFDIGYYHSEADLVIADNKVFLKGVDITSSLPAGVIRTGYFYDAREGTYVKTTDIHVEDMYGTKVRINGKNVNVWPENGLVYAYRTDSTKDKPYGIRITDAAKLPGKVTWVSPNPVYLWGDYNLTANGKYGSAVICDAINFLSKSWDDSKRPGRLPKKPASTHYNLGIIAGGMDTTVGNYNGGIENYPRFHEDWSGVKVHMDASFVNLWDSEIGTGKWSYGGDRYTAPKRDWYFETDFLDPDNLPPYTPNAYRIRTIAWWKHKVLSW